MRDRVRALQQALRDGRMRAALLTNFTDGQPNPNFVYCTGYDGFGCLLVPTAGQPILFAPKMEMARARRSGLAVREYKKETLKQLKTLRGKVGIDFSRTNMALWAKLRKAMPKAKPVTISSTLERLRLVKSPGELRSLREACRISDAVYAAAFRNFKKFKTELDVANFMNAQAAKRGVALSFDTIVAAGANAAVPHHKPTAAKLRGFVVIDFGVKVNGYCSDTTRTLFVGKPMAQQRKLYQLVRDAQAAAIAHTAVDRRCAEIHRVAEHALGKYQKQFTHSLGHGVGLEIHEAPALGPHAKHLLLDASPFTVEPGIYFPGKWGIRIEDTLVLQHGKPVLLTQFPRELVLK